MFSRSGLTGCCKAYVACPLMLLLQLSLLTNLSIAQTTIPVCSGHGELSAQDICVCELDYSITSDGLGCTAEGEDDADHDHDHDHEEECSGYGHMHDGECHCSAGYSSVNSNGTACELILEPDYFMDMLIEKYFNTTTNRIYADGIDKLIDSLGTATTVAADDKSCSGNGHWDNTECHCDSGYTLSEDGRQCTASSRRRQTTEEVVIPCLYGQSLFELYEIDMDEGATELQFSANFSPAIIQMIESGACTVSTGTTDDTDSTEAPSKGQAYLYAMVSVFIISLTSLGGVMIIPVVLKAPKTAKWVLMALVALAVGVLLGDAVLHLLPIALGVHVHSDDGGLVVLSGNEVIYRTITVCAGLFFFVVLEGILDGAGLGQHGHSHEAISPEDMVDLGMKMQEEELVTDAGLECGHTHETTHEPATSGNDSDSSDLSDRVKVTNTIDGDCIQIEKDVKPIGGVDGYDSVKINKDTDEKINEKTEDEISFRSGSRGYPRYTGWRNIDNVAWCITVGDGIHNFVDGVSVGASFAISPSTGIATAVAIFLHELPQEFGDFSIYLASGTGVKRALALNMGSGLTALLGVFLGIEAGEAWTPWVLAFTAGMFIYIALVSMYPQLKGPLREEKAPNLSNLVQGCSMVFGWSIMVLIGFTESH